MKSHWLISIKLTFVTLIVFGVIYPLLISGIAWLTAVNHGEGNLDLIGQSFTSDKYFNGRPSAINYNAAATGGSNKGPSNPDYLKQVEERINKFLQHNPTIKREDVPVDLVTASGSGLDAHISVKAANVQVARIASTRGIPAELVRKIIGKNTERPFLGLFGPERINVLKLNKALDEL
ncbi:MAG TPA: potassium-transporting ATPase subunit C [Cyclobacteriaceae bacterium]|nr:potassium-transporting ATPase subunit C [Cyclobacteriaceae bacterium]